MVVCRFLGDERDGKRQKAFHIVLAVPSVSVSMLVYKSTSSSGEEKKSSNNGENTDKRLNKDRGGRRATSRNIEKIISFLLYSCWHTQVRSWNTFFLWYNNNFYSGWMER